MRIRAACLLAISAALIIYGSLYRWEFRRPDADAWQWFWYSRHLGHEFLLNILLYVPIGFFAYAATQRAWTSSLFGVVMTAAVELVQPFFGRDPHALDLVANAAGAVAGVLVARAFTASFGKVWLPHRPLALLALWAFHQMYPFVRFGRLDRPFVPGGLDALSLFDSCAEATAAAVIGWMAWPRNVYAGPCAAAAALLLRPVTGARPLDAADLLGMAVGVAVAMSFRGRAAFPAGVAIAAATLFRELAPYRLSAAPGTFHWLPFDALLGADWFAAVIVVTRKTFLYGAVIFLLGGMGKIGRISAAVSVALFGLEWLQRWLPGRTPDITDPVLALLIGATLTLLPRDAEARRLNR